MTLLQSTLEQLRDRLDAAFQVADPRSEEWVALTNPVDLDGRIVESARNKIVMMLVGLQSDRTMRTLPSPTPGAGDRLAIAAPPLNVNAFVLFVANFSQNNYPAGLGMLSRTISFFQQNPVFTLDNLPGLAPQIDKISLDFVNLSLSETNDLMGMLGLRYMPCALYSLRTLPFVSDAVASSVPSARRTRPSDAGMNE
jgi:Pvc16 N-terminal domain